MSRWYPISASTVEALIGAGLDPSDVTAIANVALAEDVGQGVDVTTVATVPVGNSSTMDLVARAPGVLAGVPIAAAVFEMVGGPAIECLALSDDGCPVRKDDLILQVTGPTRSVLTAERTALNLLTHLSGVATLTAEWATLLRGSKTVVRDTRKTLPGLRVLEKYAVRCGGGENHRMSLNDAALIKDNHVEAAGGIVEAFTAVRESNPELQVEVEVDTIEQLRDVLAEGADLVLLDNFSIAEIKEAVEITEGRARLEASGGLTLADALEIAHTGVDYVAVGGLTHSAPALDIGADLSPNIDSGTD